MRESKTLDVTSETNWKYEFKDLPKYDEGKKIEYTVTEDHVKTTQQTSTVRQ